MNKNKEYTNNGEVGFLGLLTILFIALKLTEVITWSWLWVLSPLWLPITILAFLLLFYVGILFISKFFFKKK